MRSIKAVAVTATKNSIRLMSSRNAAANTITTSLTLRVSSWHSNNGPFHHSTTNSKCIMSLNRSSVKT